MTDADLVKRLEKLERDNWRMKRLALLALVLAAVLGAIYATRPVPDVIKAHSFEAVDGSGREEIRVSATDMPGSPRIMIYNKAHVSDVAIMGFDDGAALITLGPERRRKAFSGEIRDDVLIGDMLLPGQPTIELVDRHGYSMDLGSTMTQTVRTGQLRTTSAASITMFGNDKKHRVIWQSAVKVSARREILAAALRLGRARARAPANKIELSVKFFR